MPWIGRRLDAVLAGGVAGLSRARASEHIHQGHVRILWPPGLGGSRLKAGLQLPRGTRVEIDVQPRPALSATPESIPLDILYEDADVIVVNKPAGLVVHPAAGHETGTLVNALLHHLPEVAGVGDDLRPGLVHRIDKDTSGLLVVAKNERALRRLGGQFMRHTVERRYAAVALGTFPEDQFTIRTLHGRHPTERKKFSGKVPDGKEAITHVRVLARGVLSCLLVCRLETGRTHQIRVHLAERGHPIAGDELYGGRRKFSRTGRTAREATLLEGLPRHALHAYALGFEHPTTGERLRFEIGWPDDVGTAVAAVFGKVALPRLGNG
ncbi:MAG: RluA family pseudouridine synthase [Myxococcales bacterium]|nr:RluA family pseudouridine synthase [Myxococcales bacterium]